MNGDCSEAGEIGAIGLDWDRLGAFLRVCNLGLFDMDIGERVECHSKSTA